VLTCLVLFVTVVAYQLCLKMGDVLGDGTEGNVFIQLFGDKGMTEQIQLRQAGNSKIRFEKGRTYKFTVETIDIGKVSFVTSCGCTYVLLINICVMYFNARTTSFSKCLKTLLILQNCAVIGIYY